MSVQEDAQTLVDAALTFVEELLGEHGEYPPFGCMLVANQTQVDLVAASGNEGQEPPPDTELIALLESGFRQQAESGELLAAAIVVDVQVTPPGQKTETDAVLVRIDHREGYCVDAVFPYNVNDDGDFQLGESFLQPGEPFAFLKTARA